MLFRSAKQSEQCVRGRGVGVGNSASVTFGRRGKDEQGASEQQGGVEGEEGRRVREAAAVRSRRPIRGG